MNPEDEEDVSMENLIHSILPDHFIKGMIINSAIVFEMINSDGKIMVSVLHPNKNSTQEIASMLIAAYNSVGSSAGGFLHEEDEDE